MVLGQRGRGLGARQAAARSAGSSRRAGPGAGRSARRSPTSPRAIGASRWSEPCAAARTVTAASAVAAPALSRTVVLRKSTNRTCYRLQQRLEQTAHAGRAVDHEIGLGRQLRGSFVGADRHADRGGQGSLADERAQAAKGIQVGRVVADIQRAGDRRGGWAREAAWRCRDPCRGRRADAPPAPCAPSGPPSPSGARASAISSHGRRGQRPRPGRRASGTRRSRPCPRCARASAGARRV